MCSGDDVSDTTFMPGRMGRREVGEGLDRSALGLVAPGVHDGPHALDAERRGDVTGHRVGIDEQDVLARRIWRRRARLVATVVLPTPPFGLKTATMVARRAQRVGLDRAALEDRADAVVDGLAADAHRLDPPAQGLGGVGAGEVLVLDALAVALAAAGRASAARRPSGPGSPGRPSRSSA